MALSKAQAQIANSTARFRVAICGRRFGKTFLSIRELARFARHPNRTIFYVGPTRSQSKSIVWEQLKDRLGRLKWIKRVNESELTITLINNTTIELKSGDVPDRMRGRSCDFIVFDEVADIDESAWTVVRPALADREGHALFIGTPKGSQNWARTMYDMSLTNPDWQSWSFTTLDGGNVTEEEIESARRDLDEKLFKQEFLASWEDPGNQVLYAWNRANNLRRYEGGQPTQIFVGTDFNYNPMTSVIGVRNGDDMHLIDEIRLTSSNTDELVAELKSRYHYLTPDRIWVYPDPASRQNKTSAGGRTDLSILQNAGFTVKCPNSHDPVRDGINAVNSRLATAAGTHHLFVDPKCKYTIESIERLTYKENSVQPDKDSGYDHFVDCLRYLIGYIWPVRRTVAPQPAQRWAFR